MRVFRFASLLLILLGAGMMTACSPAFAGALSGGGATLVAPLEAAWAHGFQRADGTMVTYTDSGMDAGLGGVSGGALDFASSDAPLSAAASGACGTCAEIPWALGALSIAYHVPGIRTLRLTGTLLALIYLGKLTNWDDPRIAAVNHGVKLPSLAIAPVYPANDSGETLAFTTYLSDVDTDWNNNQGSGTTIGTPFGIATTDDLTAAALIRQTPGAIGYIGASYAASQRLHSAAIANAGGSYLTPTAASLSAAAAGTESVPAAGISIVDPPRRNRTAYPLALFTYAVVDQTPAQAPLVQQWLTYCVSSGRKLARTSGFAPIPAALATADEAIIAGL